MTRLCVLLIAVLTVVGCGARTETGATDPPTATEAGASSSSFPQAPSDPELIEFDALATEGQPVARFGATDLRFVAIIAGGVGAIDPCYALEPSWLNYCVGRFVELIHPDGKGASLEPGRDLVLAAVHPSLDGEPPRDAVRVTVTAHFDDPASEDCRYIDWEPQFGPRPSAEETVEMCQSILVITDIEPLS